MSKEKGNVYKVCGIDGKEYWKAYVIDENGDESHIGGMWDTPEEAKAMLALALEGP